MNSLNEEIQPNEKGAARLKTDPKIESAESNFKTIDFSRPALVSATFSYKTDLVELKHLLIPLKIAI